MLTTAAVKGAGAVWALGDSADAQPNSDVVGAAWLVRLAPGAADGITVAWQGRLRDDVIAPSRVLTTGEDALFAATTDSRAGGVVVRVDAQGHDRWRAIPLDAPDARVVDAALTDDGALVVVGASGRAPSPRWRLYHEPPQAR